MKILLVDDSGTMRAIQKRCLFSLGISADDIVEAANGQIGLDHLEQQTFDIVLTDCNMPIMDGMTFVKQLRTGNKTTPVIMVTTESEATHVKQAIENGVSDYLIKPFTTDALNSKLRKWVPAVV